jgi:hypothetical protein
MRNLSLFINQYYYVVLFELHKLFIPIIVNALI